MRKRLIILAVVVNLFSSTGWGRSQERQERSPDLATEQHVKNSADRLTERMMEVPLDQPFTVKLGQAVRIEQTPIQILFKSIPADSRCPIDVDCIVAGNAEVNLELRHKKRLISAIVHTNRMHGSQEIEYDSYRIKMLKLRPERTFRDQRQPKVYEVTLQVNRIEEINE
jgi:hypothetical protein